jgi:hypothetical protein
MLWMRSHLALCTSAHLQDAHNYALVCTLVRVKLCSIIAVASVSALQNGLSVGLRRGSSGHRPPPSMPPSRRSALHYLYIANLELLACTVAIYRRISRAPFKLILQELILEIAMARSPHRCPSDTRRNRSGSGSGSCKMTTEICNIFDSISG